MKISTNMIGNYTPNIARNINSSQKAKQPNKKLELNPNAVKKTDKLTSDEKTFFARMYPDKMNEVVDYHFYKKSGEMSGVKLGSIIDRRG